MRIKSAIRHVCVLLHEVTIGLYSTNTPVGINFKVLGKRTQVLDRYRKIKEGGRQRVGVWERQKEMWKKRRRNCKNKPM